MGARLVPAVAAGPGGCHRSPRTGPRRVRAASVEGRASSRCRPRQRADADDLERLATAAYMLGRDDDYVGGLERAHHAHLDGGEALRAARCAFWIGMNLVLRGEIGPRDGLARPRAAAARARGARLRRARLPAAAARCSEHEAAGDYEAALADRAPRPWRSASASATRDLFALAAQATGIIADQARAGRRGPAAARRGDGRGHRGRAVADRQRLRLLRRDRRAARRPTSRAARRSGRRR